MKNRKKKIIYALIFSLLIILSVVCFFALIESPLPSNIALIAVLASGISAAGGIVFSLYQRWFAAKLSASLSVLFLILMILFNSLVPYHRY